MTGESRQRRAASPWPYRLCLIVATGVSALVANRLAFSLFDGVPDGKRVRREAFEATNSKPVPAASVAMSEVATLHGASRPERDATELTATPPRGSDEVALEPEDGSGSDALPEPPVVKSSTSTEVVINEAYRVAPPLASDSKEGESEAEALARKSARSQDTTVAWQPDGKPVARGLRLLANDAAWKREPSAPAKDQAAPVAEPKE